MSYDVDEEFLTACEVGDIVKVKELYNSYYPTKTIFEKFTNIFNFKRPLLDLHYKLDCHFLAACSGGHLNIINFLFNDKKFVQGIDKGRLSFGLSYAISNGHLEIAKFISPSIKKDQNFNDRMYSSFQDCCKTGKIDGVKYILNDPILKVDIESLNIQQGFINACEYGQLNVIRYFLNEIKLPHSVNIKNPQLLIAVKHIEVLECFINEFNMQRNENDGLFKRLLLSESMAEARDKIFEIKEMYRDLSANLNEQSNILLVSTKRPKL